MKGKFRVKLPKTKRGVRQVEITADTVRMLARHRAAMLAAGHDVHGGTAFCSATGGFLSISNVYRDGFHPLLKAPACRRGVVRAPSHVCDITLVGGRSRQGGERTVGLTPSITLTLDTYSHVLPNGLRAAADVLSKLLSGPGA